MIRISKEDQLYVQKFINEDSLHREKYELSYLVDVYNKFQTVKGFTAYFNFLANDLIAYAVYHNFKDNNEVDFLNTLYTGSRVEFLKNVSIIDQIKQTGYYGNYVTGLIEAMVLEDKSLLTKYFMKYPDTKACTNKHIKIALNYIYHRNQQEFNAKQYEKDLDKVIALKSNAEWMTAYYNCFKALYLQNKDLFIDSLLKYQKSHLQLTQNKQNVTLGRYFSFTISFFVKEAKKIFNNEISYEDWLYYDTNLVCDIDSSQYQLIEVQTDSKKLLNLMMELPLDFNL